MKGLSGRAFAKLAERHGWRLLRITGSHHIYGKTGQDERLSIPIHGNRTLKTGLQRHFMKVAGLSDEDIV
jgi:predicted RNA binding protein YcfA (HicA-like mRNA interferase family)